MKRKLIAAALSVSLLFSTAVTVFADGEWWRDGFNYVYYHNPKIMTLDEPDQVFHPYREVSRREVADALWRFDGQPNPSSGGGKFWDAGGDTAVAYVSGAGIMNGVDDRHFDPDSLITREQMATIAYRFASAAGCDVTIPTRINTTFDDYNQISDYAWGAVVWAVNSGLMTGTGQSFEPKSNLNRGQIAMILLRLSRLDKKTNERIEAGENRTVTKTEDRKIFVENLAWLLRQTNTGLVEIGYHQNGNAEFLTLHFQDNDVRVSITGATYAEIILKVVEEVLL